MVSNEIVSAFRNHVIGQIFISLIPWYCNTSPKLESIDNQIEAVISYDRALN